MWASLRLELQHAVMAKLGGDWLVAYLWQPDMVVVINTRSGSGRLLFSREEIDDHLHRTAELERRLAMIAAGSY